MAMVNDDMNEDNVHSSLLDSITSNFGEARLSTNDLAWADSCLNDDLVGPSNTDWSSIKDVLLEILSSQAGPDDSVAAQNNTQFSIDEDLSVHNYVAGLSFGRETDDDEDLIDDVVGDIENIEISDDDEGNLITANKRGMMRTKRRIENVFRPNYSEDMVKVDSNDTGTKLNLTTQELLDSVSEDIFKVWDLGISEEQDDFTKQLDKAFSDFPPQIQPNPDDSTVWEDGTRVSVNDLVSGMSDLSLNQNTK
ncbi:uncharacterized protein LOC141600686 [Silene latifolia]|uniref:uncharacterized protein LOC141600686 n=1 Tax=Silene latifolia TaxID=37657 RepID=UPI003D781F61